MKDERISSLEELTDLTYEWRWRENSGDTWSDWNMVPEETHFNAYINPPRHFQFRKVTTVRRVVGWN